MNFNQMFLKKPFSKVSKNLNLYRTCIFNRHFHNFEFILKVFFEKTFLLFLIFIIRGKNYSQVNIIVQTMLFLNLFLIFVLFF